MAASVRQRYLSRRRPKPRGFTLVEVLVALAVLAIALAAALRAAGQSIDLSINLRARTLALWVAEERATQLRLSRSAPAGDTKEGTMELGGQQWRWRERSLPLENPYFQFVEIDVRASDSPDTLARLSVSFRKATTPSS